MPINTKRSIRLTDAEYLTLLEDGLRHLDTIEKVTLEDSTCPGDKYTTTNCGLCNEGLTTVDTALFPEMFPGRKDMKYRDSRHKCPLDWRENPDINGCFYTCMVFKRKLRDINKMKELYKAAIDAAEETTDVQD